VPTSLAHNLQMQQPGQRLWHKNCNSKNAATTGIAGYTECAAFIDATTFAAFTRIAGSTAFAGSTESFVPTILSVASVG